MDGWMNEWVPNSSPEYSYLLWECGCGCFVLGSEVLRIMLEDVGLWLTLPGCHQSGAVLTVLD